MLVHDVSNTDTTKEQVDALFTTICKSFGGTNHCHLLQINSHEGEKEPGDDMSSLWQNVPPMGEEADEPRASSASPGSPSSPGSPDGSKRPSSPPAPEAEAAVPKDPKKARGLQLGIDDLQHVRNFVHAFGTNGLLPHLEYAAQQLHAHIAQSKKSMVKSLKVWAGFSSQSKSPAQADTNIFSGMSARDAMRRLGDISFTLQDYETAHNTYHSVKKDLNPERHWKHFAGTQEMLGISSFMQDSRVDCRYHDVAIKAYMKCSATVYANRAMLTVAEMLTSRGQYKDASTFFMRMTSEESDLRSALLYEQASMCFLQMKPVCQRRAAFHLVLAGHRFTKAGQRCHALRCYLQARQVYNGRGWQLAEDHVNYTIGRQALHLGHAADALDAFTRLLTDSQQFSKQQNMYIKEFVQAWRQVHADGDNDADLKHLPVPIVLDKSLQLQLREECSLSKDMAVEWKALETELLVQVFPKRARVSSVSILTRHTDNTQKPVCVAGESLNLQFELFNPLHVPLELRDIKLVTQMDGDGATPPEATSIPTFKIPSKSRKIMVLQATPRSPGPMTITGFRYCLGGNVEGCQNFLARGPRLNKTKKHYKDVMYGPDLRLTPIVIPPMPLLTGAITGLEKPIVAGQLVRASISIKNNSDAQVINLHFASSRPDLVLFDNDANTDPNSGYLSKSKGKKGKGINIFKYSSVLGAQAEAEVPIYFSAPAKEVGDVKLLIMMAYEAEHSHDALPYRVLRLTTTVKVQPSVATHATIHKIPQVLDERLLKVTTFARQPRGSVKLKSMVVESTQWHVALDGWKQDRTFELNSGEALSFVCRLKRKEYTGPVEVHTQDPLKQLVSVLIANNIPQTGSMSKYTVLINDILMSAIESDTTGGLEVSALCTAQAKCFPACSGSVFVLIRAFSKDKMWLVPSCGEHCTIAETFLVSGCVCLPSGLSEREHDVERQTAPQRQVHLCMLLFLALHAPARR